jgi:hypothetical protein
MHAQWKIVSSKQSIRLAIDDFIDLDQAGSAFSDPTFTLAKPSETKTISISGSDSDANAQWRVGLALIQTGSSVTLSADNLSLGAHTLRVTATYGGTPYSKELTFTVE